MSFLSKIVDIGKRFVSSDIGSSIAKTAGLAFMLSQVNRSVNKANELPDPPDEGVRIQLDPNTENPIPVVYGEAYVAGAVTDAHLASNNSTMWFCLTLCEKTGTLLSDGEDSVITFEDIYWNDTKITFRSDGVTAALRTDSNGNTSTDIAGLVKIYCYNNGSLSPVNVRGNNGALPASAKNVFPIWGSDHDMSDLVFMLVRVDYDAEKDVKGLADIQVRLKNTLTQPGDVLFDYMTNTRYGAGIKEEEINSG